MKIISPEYAPLIETHFCDILNILSDGIYITDREGKTITVNSTYEKLTGLKKEELLGRNVTDLIKDGTFDTALNPEIVRTGKSITTVQVNRKGRKVVLTGHPVFSAGGEVELVVTFVRDITLMSQLREQISDQRELIEKYQRKFQAIEKKKGIVTESAKMREMMQMLKKVAATDATALFLGETGVGKDVFSRKLHEYSLRSDKPFFKVDCTSIPENLIESELFGYAPGAFSGANSKGKPGFFEMADKGTLFLDEIGELPLPMQGKLLRVLQDGEIIRVGGTKVKKVDVRIIAATNRDLEAEVQKGRFRSDLFYRLRVAVLEIPPLRERIGDILPMARHFLDKFHGKYKKRVRLSDEAEALMASYRWPGNVREMENLIHSLIVTCEDGTIRPADLPSAMHTEPVPGNGGSLRSRVLNTEGKSLRDIMNELEKDLIMNALEVHGSIPKVADAFKVDRTTIFRKVKKYMAEDDDSAAACS